MKMCSIEGCGKPMLAKGLCNVHYIRVREHGDPMFNANLLRIPIEDRFWKKVIKSENCWEWVGNKNNKGYGQLSKGGRLGNALAHRVSYEIHNGKIPGGLFVLHKCDNPGCVRPDHLFLGTNSDNMQDMLKKGRFKSKSLKGEKCKFSKLNESQVMEIKNRLLHGDKARLIARAYGVSDCCISGIKCGKTWKHIEETHHGI
ncbi:MAG: HNH endonuclease signature motif containing protein [Burkholderiales bacterium]